MKRIFSILVFILMCFSLVSCKVEEVDLDEVDTDDIMGIKELEEFDLNKYKSYVNKDELFKITVYISDENYKSNEPISMFSTLEYLGKEESIDVWSGRPYFNYIIVKDEIYFSEGIVEDILMKSNFKKDEVYLIPFRKSGGYSADDPDYEFWKNYYSDPELKLPEGTYAITAFCDFSLSEDILSSRYENKVEFEIEVHK